MRLPFGSSAQSHFLNWRISLLLSLSASALLAGSTPTTTSLTTSGSPSVYGSAVTLTATLSPSVASGKVTFYDEATILGTSALTSGVAVLRSTMIESGRRSLRAIYTGDSTYASSKSSSVTQIVNTVPDNGFLPPVNYTVLSTPQSIMALSVGDFNGDGITDLVSMGFETLHILLGNGDGTFRNGPDLDVSSALVGAVGLLAADLNRDGKTDLVLLGDSDYQVGNSVLLNNGDATFRALPAFSLAEFPDLAAGDFNGDGIPDLVASSGNNTPPLLTVWLSNGDGTFSGGGEGSIFASYPIVVADFNGDGNADVAQFRFFPSGPESSLAVQLQLGNGDGTFMDAMLSPLPSGDFIYGNAYLATGDFNGDGKIDMALSSDNPAELHVWLGNGDGTFGDPVIFPIGNGEEGLRVADFNGDGKDDLVTLTTSAAIVRLSNGDRTFQPPVSYGVVGASGIVNQNAFSSAFAVADFNGDGRTDLAVGTISSTSATQVSILEGSAGATGGLLPSTTLLTSSENPSFGGAATGNDSVTFTATVAASDATGTIAFMDGSTALATVALSHATATLTTASLAPGTHALTAVYGGDMHYYGSASSVLNQRVIPLTIPAPEPSPAPITGNLLINPGAENGSYMWSSYWYDLESGQAHSGTSAFLGLVEFSPAADSFVSQTVNLSAVAGISLADIDSGALTANYSFWFSRFAGEPGGYGAITLTFLDGSGTRIGEGISPASGGGPATWYNVVGSIAIPSGARSVVYTMDFWSSLGIESVIDDNVLTISRNALTPNLLTNPGAETGNLTGWYAAYGAPPAAALGASSYFGASSGNSPHSGRYMFFGGATPNNYLTQTVSLSTVSQITLADVDAGLLTANYSFWYADKNGGAGSLGRITLSFYDGNKNLIVSNVPLEVKGTTVNYGGGVTSVPWFNETGTFAIPPDTRTINYTMDFNGTTSQNSGVIDDNILTISRR
jgi:hypothetical protein